MKKFPIDLSCLTEEEISQFQEDPYTLYNGDQNVAIYLRYSSTGQSDQSIEGQLRDCRTFCKANHYRIVAIYVDRATTARKDVEKRVHLMEMISDSAKQNWEYVIVWKLDRFARNRNDSAIMKMRLRKNGVKVLSATEHLTDSPESIILESVLEGMAEFFSAELSQKVTRGMRESALKCHSVGGHIPLGYKVENHKLVVDPDTAHIVQEAFSLYANGESVAGICRKFNSAGYKTAKNTEFNRSSFKTMFRNTRYIGTYTYKDIVIENGIPAIIDKELFETVQRRLSKTATAPARGKAKVDYLLSGKLFCGHCGASMNGESGAGRHGKVYHYYSCYTKKRKLGCDKRPLKKDYIEGIVARDALNLLTDQLIDEIADMAIRQSEQDLINDTHIPQLTAQLSEVEKSITNITAAIEKGIASETLMNRLVQLEHEKKTLNKEIKAEEKFVYRIDRDQIVFWLSQFKYGNIEDEDFRRRLIDLLVNSVTVWDEPDGYKITTAYNLTSCKTKTFRVEKNPAAEEATGFDFGESECAIRAMASFPGYDVTDVAAALEAADSPLLNRATAAWNVGSIFKVCVAAAALENEVELPENYCCEGFYRLGDHSYFCHERAGHGTLDLQQAMQLSCNPYFVELGQRTGAQALLRMAQRLGFGAGSQLAEGVNSSAGSLPTLAQATPGELANLSFGQGRLTATPVQVAGMLAAVANGGYAVQPTLFAGRSFDGKILQSDPAGEPIRVMNTETAETLRALLVSVVEEGTGYRAANRYCGAGGKTASAQTGRYQEGEEIVHAWFGGFFPAGEPKYVLVVFQEGGRAGGQTPASVFRAISEAVYCTENPGPADYGG